MTDTTSSPSARGTTSGPTGPPPTDPDSETTSVTSKELDPIVGPAPCSVCGTYVSWYPDHVWRQSLDDGPHTCGGYYARHRAENPDAYLPLHEMKDRIPTRDKIPDWKQGLRRGTKRW